MNTPLSNVKTLYAEIPGLRAEESLHAVTVAQIGGGLVERRDARRILNSWEREAGLSEPKPATVQEQRAFAADFARMR